MFGYGIAWKSGSAAVLALIFMAIILPFTAADDSGAVVVPLETSMQDLAGSWSLALIDDDNVTRDVNLTLYQTEGAVFGRGNLTADNMTRAVAVGGFLEGDGLNLNLISEEGDFIFNLAFTVDEGSISGDYRGYFSDGSEISGSGSGSWYVPETAMRTWRI